MCVCVYMYVYVYMSYVALYIIKPLIALNTEIVLQITGKALSGGCQEGRGDRIALKDTNRDRGIGEWD
jgi:hypothetical protein